MNSGPSDAPRRTSVRKSAFFSFLIVFVFLLGNCILRRSRMLGKMRSIPYPIMIIVEIQVKNSGESGKTLAPSLSVKVKIKIKKSEETRIL